MPPGRGIPREFRRFSEAIRTRSAHSVPDALATSDRRVFGRASGSHRRDISETDAGTSHAVIRFLLAVARSVSAVYVWRRETVGRKPKYVSSSDRVPFPVIAASRTVYFVALVFDYVP